METEYYRKRNIVRGPEGDEVFKSVNGAKRYSHKIQKANGGLGRGSLVVVDKFPKRKKKKEK